MYYYLSEVLWRVLKVYDYLREILCTVLKVYDYDDVALAKH